MRPAIAPRLLVYCTAIQSVVTRIAVCYARKQNLNNVFGPPGVLIKYTFTHLI